MTRASASATKADWMNAADRRIQGRMPRNVPYSICCDN